MTTRSRHHESQAMPPTATRRAFTLVELLVVMTLLTVVLAIAAPSLGKFFHARTLDSEARRLLALTRSGGSRAVAEGLPMVLWLDAKQGSYGLEAEPGYDDRDPKAVEFKMDKDLTMAVADTNTRTNLFAGINPITGRSQILPAVTLPDNRGNLPQIRFLPDGSIDGSSPQSVRLQDRDGNALSLALSDNRLNYAIQSQLTNTDGQ